MIIQCKSCSRKFIVKDKDIPAEGRTVQCGYCSVTWHQLPITIPTDLIKPMELEDVVITKKQTTASKKTAVEQMEASDGKNYQFLNNQWAQLLPSGKTGIFAKKKISAELNKITGKKQKKPSKKKSKKLDPSSATTSTGQRLPDIYKPKDGVGFFGYIFLIFIISLSTLGIIETFENDILKHFPESQYFFNLIDGQLEFIIETFKNMVVIIKDLTSSY